MIAGVRVENTRRVWVRDKSVTSARGDDDPVRFCCCELRLLRTRDRDSRRRDKRSRRRARRPSGARTRNRVR